MSASLLVAGLVLGYLVGANPHGAPATWLTLVVVAALGAAFLSWVAKSTRELVTN
jgi:hypothetical protein